MSIHDYSRLEKNLRQLALVFNCKLDEIYCKINESVGITIKKIIFNSSTGNLLFEFTDNTTISVNLDGRYSLIGHTHEIEDIIGLRGILEYLEEGMQNVSDKNYVYVQGIASDTWVMHHPLNKKVSVYILDTAGTVVEGQVSINNGSLVIVKFKYPFSGEAVLN